MILIQSVSKAYRLYRRPSDRILEMCSLLDEKHRPEFWALRDVSLSVEKGETLALIGRNGSGKSTLLQVVCGIVQPTNGRVSTEGRIAALLELGAGFNPEFTGRENVFLNGEIMGLSRRQVEDVFPLIEGFADIGGFIDRPVKEYSSGMYVRLAFSTAIHVDPDILVVDEALAVGDAIFSNRCVKKFEELKEKNVTILFVSHDLGLVKQLADRAVLMDAGRIAAQGSPSDVVNRYVGMVLGAGEAEPEKSRIEGKDVPVPFRHGNRASRILDVQLLDSAENSVTALESGQLVTIRVRARFDEAASDPVVGILVRNRLGIDVFGTNTRVEGQRLGEFEPGDILQIDFSLNCLLTRQEYTLTVATQNWDGTSQDWLDDVLAFSVIEPKDLAGLVNTETSVKWKRIQPTNQQT